MAKIPYKKMHGSGNQILILDNRDVCLPAPSAERVVELAGDQLGFDQMMWLERPSSDSALAGYRVFNADGSEAEQCGNGLRCIAWLLAEEHGDPIALDSPAGIVHARRIGDFRTAVSMGRPVFDPERIPFTADREQTAYSLTVDEQCLEIFVLSMGNPHCVLDVDDVARAEVGHLGPLIEAHRRFPERVNVGFRQIIDRNEIRLRVFERGAGETLACGTGACAAVVSGIRSARLEPDVRVGLRGGEVVVSWHGDDVWLTGDVKLEQQGSIDL